MRGYLSWGVLGIAIAVSCGGRVLDTGAGGTGGSTTVGGTTTGTGGTTVGGTTTGSGGTTVGGTTGGTGGTTVGGTTSGTGGATTGVGGTGTKGGAGGTGGSGGTGGAIDPGADLSSCTGPGQCELAMAKCCSCGILGLDLLAAINSAKRDAYSKTVCGAMPNPCPPCVGTIEPHLMARCESGRCRGFDIRTDPTYTKCGSDQECFLRKGLSCCECQAAGDWVAVSRFGGMLISGEACAAGSVCPSCVPVPPVELVAVCRNGACTEMKIPATIGSGLP